MPRTNVSLNKAKQDKDDEFYTFIEDINKELSNYQDQFEGKTIYCNCDSEKSNFIRFFKENFNRLEIKELIYSSNDFNAQEFRKIKKADIVITNPPFSLFREYISQLVENNKKFLILGLHMLITTVYFWKIFQKQVWKGYNDVKEFYKPDGSKVKNKAY